MYTHDLQSWLKLILGPLGMLIQWVWDEVPRVFSNRSTCYWSTDHRLRAIKNLPAVQETQVQSLDQEDPMEKGMTTTPVSLPGEFHGQGSLVG